MNKQRMTKMLECAKSAIAAAGLGSGHNDLVGQLILASAIEESGSSISMSLDKLDGLTLEISEIARAISNHSQ